MPLCKYVNFVHLIECALCNAPNLLFDVGVEFDPTQPPRLNERVLKDKRKKLRETFDRVINMYVSMLWTSSYWLFLSSLIRLL